MASGMYHGKQLDYATEMVVEGVLLTFSSKQEKAAFVKVLKGQVKPVLVEEAPASPPGGVAEPPMVVEWKPSKDQLEALRRLGWLRDEETPEADTTAKVKVVDIGSNPRLGPGIAPVFEGKKARDLYGGICVRAMQVVGYKPQVWGDFLEKIEGQWAQATLREKLLPQLEKKGIELFSILVEVLESTLAESKVKEALLKTGRNLLVLQDDQDLLLGQKTNKQSVVEGQNLLGLAWMYLRAQIGGSPDPRLELMLGQKQYQARDLEFNWAEETREEDQAYTAELMARCLLPKAPDSEKALNAWEGAKEMLVHFITINQWWPFPNMENMVLVFDGGSLQMPKPLKEWVKEMVNYLSQTGEGDIVAAKEHPVLGKGFLTGADSKQLKLGDDFIVELNPYELESHANWPVIKLGSLCDWWAWYLSEQTRKLTPELQAQLFEILAMAKTSGAKYQVRGARVSITDGNEVYEWNFKYRSVKARQTRTAFHKAIYNGKGCDSAFTLLWLALECKRDFTSINGKLATMENLWQREANYGFEWESNHPTRVIRENSGAPLQWQVFSTGGFGLEPLNDKFTDKLFLELISTEAYRYGAYTDKNGNKLLADKAAAMAGLTAIVYPAIAHAAFEALDQGVNPLLVLGTILPLEKVMGAMIRLLNAEATPELIVMEEFGIFMTGCDGAKVTKILARVQQGASFNEAWAVLTITLENGEVVELKREASLMCQVWEWKDSWEMASEADEEALLAEF